MIISEHKVRWGARIILGAVFLATVFFFFQILHLKIDPSNESMLPRDDPAYGYLQEFRQLFGSEEFLLVAVEGNNVEFPERTERAESIAEKIRLLQHIRKVQSPLRPSGFEKMRLKPDDARRLISKNPAYENVLASQDMRHLALLVWIDQVDGDRTYRESIVREVREIVGRGTDSGFRAYVAGIPVQKNDISAYVRKDQERIVPVMFLLVAIIIYGVYRSFRVTLLTVGLVGLGLLWTLGFLSLFGKQLNTVTGLLSPLIMIVTLGNSIHFVSRFALLSHGKKEPMRTGLQALRDVLTPCFLASLTTAGGLLTIAALGVPAVQEFALFASAGVSFSFLLSMSVYPILICITCGNEVFTLSRTAPRWMRRSLNSASLMVSRRPKTVIAVALLATSVALTGLSGLVVDTDIIKTLRPTAPLFIATDFIDRNMGGVNSLEIISQGPNGEGMDKLPLLKRVARLQDFLERQPEVTKTYSVVDGLVFSVDGKSTQERRNVSENVASIFSMMKKFGLAPAIRNEIRSWLTQDFTRLRITARMKAVTSVGLQKLVDRVRRFLADDLHNSLIVKMTGNFLLLSNMSNNLVSRQIIGLLLACVFVLATIGILFRSSQLMILSAIPNLIPIGAVFGLMGWLGISLNVPTAMISSVSMGLVVDSTIHFLYGYRNARRKGYGRKPSLRRTIRTTGKPITISALILIGGFWVGILGNFLPVVYFSIFTGLTILLAVLCDLLFLPAMLSLTPHAWETKI